MGAITSTASAPRAVGTTVVLKDLFKTLPVRHKARESSCTAAAAAAAAGSPDRAVVAQDFLRNIKREFGKLLSLMQAYALICVGVRLVVTHTAGRAPRATVVHTQGGGSLRENIVTVLGAASANAMQPFTAALPGGCTVTGFVSSPSPGSGRSSGDRQFLYVNGRPVDLPRVVKALNEVYRSFNSAQLPAAVLDVRLPTDAYDVNVTPDKRRVMLHAEEELLGALREALTAAYEPSRGTYAVGTGEPAFGAAKQRLRKSRRSQAVGAEADWVSDGDDTEGTEEEEEEYGTSGSDGGSGGGGGDDDSASARQMRRAAHARKRARGSGSGGAAGGSVAEPQQAREHDVGVATGAVAPQPAAVAAPDFRRFSQAFTQQTPAAHSRARASGSAQRAPVAEQSFMRRFIAGGTAAAQQAPPEGGDTAAAAFMPLPPGVDDAEEAPPDTRSPPRTAYNGDASQQDATQVDTAPSGGRARAYHAPVAGAVDASRTKRASTLAFDLSALRVRWHARTHFVCMCTRLTAELTRCAHPQAARAARQQALHRSAPGGGAAPRRCFAAASLQAGALGAPDGGADAAAASASVDAEVAATAELERSFTRADFASLRVAGQFNLGFILAVLGDDLFIVDQHASDEIYNFERLRRTTVLNKQPLIAPQPLELSAAEQQAVLQHADTFRANGFEFGDAAAAAEQGTRLCLTAVPFSKNTTFGAADVTELLALLDGGAAHAPAPAAPGSGPFGSLEDGVVRPSRVRAMLAMRACRCSIMIGRALDTQQARTCCACMCARLCARAHLTATAVPVPAQMERVLLHLSELKAPWNCPHGRPTMRHLADLRHARGE
jgi:DNA mismatch repair protein PMS2